MQVFDAIIIGSGQGGAPLAKKLAGAGWKTALIEKHLIGGTCVNAGCTPTKTMIASSRLAYMASKSHEWGISIDSFSPDIKKIVSRKNEVVRSFREGSESKLEETANLELFRGEAFFSGQKEIGINLQDGTVKKLTAPKIFINTGEVSFIPPVKGLEEVAYYTSSTILDVEEIPQRLIIIGSGYIGLELGQLFQRLGSRVTIVEKSTRFLSKEDEDIADNVKAFLEEEGIEILLHASVERVRQNSALEITLDLNTDTGPKTISGTALLIAAGRHPQTAALQLQHAGVECDDKGHIKVNGQLETNVPGIYALGDIKGGPAFTHISYNDYVILYKNLLENAALDINDRMVPYCMFTDPQLGRIGLTEKAAREKGLDIKVATLPMSSVARGIETGHTKGMMKAIVDARSHQVLGAAILGDEGGEVMTVLQMAMMGRIPYQAIRDGVFAHPTYSESLNNLFMTLDS